MKMSNTAYTLANVVREQRRQRLQNTIDTDGLTVSQSYELAVAVMEVQRPQDKFFPGHCVNDRGELKPIPGAICGYDENGRPVVAPMKVSQPHRRLKVYSAEALAKVNGHASLAEGRMVDVAIPPKDDAVPAPRTVISEHQEKAFTFTDGSKKLCCTATGCLWGMPTGGKKKSGEPVVRKTHSDGLRVHESFGVDLDDEVETSPDDTQELTPETFYTIPIKQATPVAGGETEAEADDPEEARIAQAVDAAVVEAYGGSDAT